MKIYLRKMPNGTLVPDDEDSTAFVAKIKNGHFVRAEVRQLRNYPFLKKFMAMVRVGFDHWEPPEREFRGMPVQKNFKKFRHDCIIAAGYFDTVVNFRGDVRAEAKSIAFESMSEEEFTKVYDAVANVLLEKVLKNYTRADLDRVVQELQNFTS